MKKNLFTLIFAVLLSSNIVYAQTTTHTVEKGDTLWKIATKYKVGISEIIDANPHFKNPNMIHPSDKVYIPTADKKQVGIEQEILNLVNAERSKVGATPLEIDWQVSRVAKYKSDDMANKNYFSHESPTYGSPFDMLKSFSVSYKSAGENIAKGQKSAGAVMNSWMNSDGHRKNILSKNFTHLGVGYTEKNGTTYWVQMFTR